jgi:hypothetical protein
MGTEVATTNDGPGEITRVLVQGDLKGLSEYQRADYYNSVCASLGLNPLTRPFDFLVLNGKLQLYARKDATEQLRKINGLSLAIVAREIVNGVYVVTTRATTPAGRCDESVGAVFIDGLKGEALANAMMKAETKSKRRATLSICGLGLLDETEAEAIVNAQLEPASPAPVAKIVREISPPVDLVGKDAPTLIAGDVLTAIVKARPAWYRAQGVDSTDEKACAACWASYLWEDWHVRSAKELTRDQGEALLKAVLTVGHQQHAREIGEGAFDFGANATEK